VTFNSLSFLFVFLPVCLLGFYMPGMRPYRMVWLAAMSLAFYGFTGVLHLVTMVISVVWAHVWSRSPRIVGNTWVAATACFVPLGLLFYYKYLAFTLLVLFGLSVETSPVAAALMEKWDPVLPAGISFFSFHIVSYVIDRYRGQIQTPPTLLKMMTFVSFFPQLVAGPIVRYDDVSNQLGVIERQGSFNVLWGRAIGFFVFGLLAKTLLADNLHRYVTLLAGTPDKLDAVASGYLILAYSFQIYFDFYGYSLMAVGLGMMFGFQLPRNFMRPYESLNPRDFWRRWHMSLSFWIRDYLYMPLGGNRKYLRNILIIFAACGLWHGAGLNFVVWGLYHAALVLGYHYSQRLWNRLPALLQMLATFILVSLGWMLFLFDFNAAWQVVRSLAGNPLASVAGAGLGVNAWGMLAVSAAVCFTIRFEGFIERYRLPRWAEGIYSIGLGAATMAALLLLDRSTDFIYFRF
jgi:alginate O-acetyltransferase complex protein AlgI